MPTPVAALSAALIDVDALAGAKGRIGLVVAPGAKLDVAARRINRLTKGALVRMVESDAFEALKPGQSMTMGYPAGMEASEIVVVSCPRRPAAPLARKVGAAMAKGAKGPVLACLGATARAADIALGAALRSYAYTDMKSAADAPETAFTFMVSKPEELTAALPEVTAMAEGVFFTRDLVSAPANVLTTTSFADQLIALGDLGVKVEVLEEADMEKLGMGCLLGVGIGSEMPSKIVVMRWENGDKEAAPLALVGKGVTFDTGGISLKPAGGMEDMTMDMGGAGVVSGVMHALAKRGAKANVIGLVGLVENMPDGKAQRPGDVVTSMKGDTVEVINTDAEGRLVLADVMWYAQDRFQPAAMIDLATLTGAVIVALGHENAGVFSNDDALCNAFLKAASTEGEGAWRMPLGDGYAELLKSPIADVKNVGTRWGGAVTAAEFLRRFVAEGTPWIHLDIAGVAKPAGEGDLAPKGASGWGVLSLDRLVRDMFEA
ncbi:leucyl aminopeptidase [Alphaproteobacteria bacterium KMM 3653]|uniref:Probable cytosol aminopeptidase n=1 Tax=Harenicola maris TaxID=2841044 RepID=A0AAP2CRU7_9RHOB|nr:leucyl aminopeptidase [Harenicola maris]